MNASLRRPLGALELSISPENFAQIASIAHRDAGLVISETKLAMVQSRLIKRLRALGLRDFGEYIGWLNGPDGAEERRKLISALTTNVSHFFRESHHFETLRTQTIPELVEKAKSGKRVRLWSAGCSNGQEPYSIALTLLEAFPDVHNYDVRVLATDIDPEVLAFAQRGSYPHPMLQGIAAELRKKYMETDNCGQSRFNSQVRNLVHFRMLNLHAPWPMKIAFDTIFCRNVMIYFDETAQDQLYKRFTEALAEDAWLFLGHSERLGKHGAGKFKPAGVTTYRRLAKGTRI